MSYKGIALSMCISFLFSTEQSMAELVDITKINSRIKVDCVYATIRNFTKRQIYRTSACYLLSPVALQLDKVQKELEKKGLGLLVWDAYRPLAAQQRLWDVCPDSRFVADPKKGGKHTRGTAVDLTIVRLSDGSLLEMGTGHDDFTSKAASHSKEVSQEAQKNRALLRNVMIKYDFTPIANEWWHFDFHDWRNCPVLKNDFDVIE